MPFETAGDVYHRVSPQGDSGDQRDHDAAGVRAVCERVCVDAAVEWLVGSVKRQSR